MLKLAPLAIDSGNGSNSAGINLLILNCYQYYEKLKECDKEEKHYIPSIYGINSNPASKNLEHKVAFKE